MNNNGVTWRKNETVEGVQPIGDANVGQDKMTVDGPGSRGTAYINYKMEEMPYAGKPITTGPTSPQTDKQGMKIMGESDGTGRDING